MSLWDIIGLGASLTSHVDPLYQGMGSLLNTGSNMLDDAINPNSAGNIARNNFNLQKETFEYQKALQQTMFNREDNSVQRRVADLKAAGLNPMFAMGQGANAGQEIRLSTPQMDRSSMDAREDRRLAESQMMLNMMQMKADISKTEAESQAILSGIGFEERRLNQADRGLGQTDTSLSQAADRFRGEMTFKGADLSLRTAEMILSRSKLQLERDFYNLQVNRDAIESTLKAAQERHLNEETARLQLINAKVPVEMADMLLDGHIKLRDLQLSIATGMRYKDSYAGTLGSVKQTTDSFRTKQIDQSQGSLNSVLKEMQDAYNKATGNINKRRMIPRSKR